MIQTHTEIGMVGQWGTGNAKSELHIGLNISEQFERQIKKKLYLPKSSDIVLFKNLLIPIIHILSLSLSTSGCLKPLIIKSFLLLH